MPRILIVERVGTNETHCAELFEKRGTYLIDGEFYVRAAGFWGKYRFIRYVKSTPENVEIES